MTFSVNLGRQPKDRRYVRENVTNVFGMNLCQLRKDAYPDQLCFRPFSFRSGST